MIISIKTTSNQNESFSVLLFDCFMLLNNLEFSFRLSFFKLKYSWYTILVSGVQHSDSAFLQIIHH